MGGVSVVNNKPKKFGVLLQGVGAGLSGLSDAVSTKVRYCALVGIQAEARARDQEILPMAAGGPRAGDPAAPGPPEFGHAPEKLVR